MFGTGIDNSGIKQGLTSLDNYVTTFAANITAQIASAVVQGLSAIPAKVTEIGSAFESSMSQVAATMGITSAASEFDMLSEKAKEMGEATKFSASQAGDALNFLALSGMNAEKSCAALPTVLNLAAAGGMELASASDMVTDSMSALGLEMSELETFSDMLAKTSQKSNTSVSQLGAAILSVGANAQILAGGTNELMTELGILADSGLKSAEAGTALYRVIKNLSTPMQVAKDELDRLRVSCYDAEGNFRNMQDIFKDLDAAMDGFTAEQVQASLSKIFDTAALSSAKVLLSQCGDRFDELSGLIDDCKGAAADMADTMNDNLTGDITICQSALEGLANTAYESFSGTMRSAVQSVTADVGTLNESLKNGELSESIGILSDGFADLTASAASLLTEDILPSIITGLSVIIENGNTIIGVAAGIAAQLLIINNRETFAKMSGFILTTTRNFALLRAETTAETFQQAALNSQMSLGEIAIGLFSGQLTLATAKEAAMTAAQTALNAAMSANPVGLIVTALSALAIGIGAVIGAMKDHERQMEENTVKARDYAGALEEVRKQGQEEIDNSDSEIAVLKEKGERYEELRLKLGDLTDGEMAEFKALAEELQDVLPEGTQLINEQTNSYEALGDKIDLVCAKMEKQALLNAKYKEYEEAVSQNYDIDEQIKSAENALSLHNSANANPEGIKTPDMTLDDFCEKNYGLSYQELLETKNQNQKVIDGYHELYEETYNEIDDVKTPCRTACRRFLQPRYRAT